MSNPLLSAAAWSARRLPMPVKRLFYRIPPLARLLRGALNRAAPAGLSEVTIAAGGLQGLTMLLDLHSEKDYWLGTYEPELQTALAELVQPGTVAYDVGANAGYISLLLARLAGPQGQVFAFEALPENAERLQRNVALNHLEAQVSVVHAAVIDASRPVRFLIGPSDDMGKAEGSAGRQEMTYTQAIEVTGISLDDFVYTQGHSRPQVIKLDIEGGEVLALPGMRRLLRQVRPLLLIELHGPEAARAAWETLRPAGYRLCQMRRGWPVIKTLDELDWKAYLVAFPPRPVAGAADES